MIYFHQTPNIVQATGYGGAFQNLCHALFREFPVLSAEVLTYPWYHYDKTLQPDLEIWFGTAFTALKKFYETRHAPRRGIFTMNEYRPMGLEFVENIREHFDFVIVPSRWSQEIFREELPELDVYLVPLGVDTHYFPFLQRNERDIFTYIWQGFRIRDRKHAELVEQAFIDLGLPDSRLIVKYLASATKYKQNLHWPAVNRIHRISTDYSHAEMLSLWQSCDFAVIPSEGEGFGLIPLEMMATGLPVAVPLNSAQKEFADPLYCYPMQCTVEVPKFGRKVHTTASIPSLGELKRVMLHAYNNRSEIRATGRAASDWIHKQWTYSRGAQAFAQVLTTEVERSEKGEYGHDSQNTRTKAAAG